VAASAAVVDALLWLYLYSRPTPFARPFALDPSHYVFHAIYYGVWAHVLLLMPFVALALWAKRYARAWFISHLAVTWCVLMLGALDREFQRFMGMHATLSWLKTYGAIHRTPQAIVDGVVTDAGGAYGSLLPLPFLLAFPFMVRTLAKRFSYPFLTPMHTACLVAVFFVLPSAMWTVVPGGRLRQSKVRPALLIAWRELRPRASHVQSASEVALYIDRYHAHQKAHDPSHAWAFTSREYPLLKHYTGATPASVKQPNIIVLQLETFRAKDMKSTNPALTGVSPTPFLDRLAADPNSALFSRHLASGAHGSCIHVDPRELAHASPQEYSERGYGCAYHGLS
jgi:hypothetical protein